MKYLFAFLFLTCLGANARTSDCVPLLSSSTSPEESPFQAAYLSLLDLTLEGLDEVENHAFGHGDRLLVKTKLLNNLALSEAPISPLDKLQTKFSPKLSTLADSGQFQAVIENLITEDWRKIRRAAQQKLSELQNIQTAQAVATPKTEHDFEEIPDHNGNTRLHRLILTARFVEALTLVESSSISQRYLNTLNGRNETAIDLLQRAVSIIPDDQVASQLYKILRAKGALDFLELNQYEDKMAQAIRAADTGTIQKLYDLGISIAPNAFSDETHQTHSFLNQAINARSLKTVKLLIRLGAQQTMWAGSTPLMYCIRNNAPRQIIETLLLENPNLEIQSLRAKEFNRTAFLLAAAACREDVLKLLIERGANVYAVDEDNRNFLHLINDCNNSTKIMNLFRHIPLGQIINQSDQKSYLLNETPLHQAVKNKNVNLVKRLIQRKADPFIMNRFGFTAFELANGDETLLSALTPKKGRL